MRVNIFWLVAFVLWVLMVSAALCDEPCEKSWARIDKITVYETVGDYHRPIWVCEPDIMGGWRWRRIGGQETPESEDTALIKPYCVATLTVIADNTQIIVVTMKGLESEYTSSELVQVLRTRDGRWIPLFEKLKK